jgi:hypothetical protein
MGGPAGSVRNGYRFGIATRRGNAIQTGPLAQWQNDRVVCTPARAATRFCRRIRDPLAGASNERHLVQSLVREETDPLTVRCEERISRTVRPGDRHRVVIAQRAYVELRAASVPSDVHDSPSVR